MDVEHLNVVLGAKLAGLRRGLSDADRLVDKSRAKLDALEKASNRQTRLSPSVQRAFRQSRREVDALGESAKRTGRLLDGTGRGMLAGSGAARSFARSIAFASSAFLGGAGLGAGLRFVVGKAASFQTEMFTLGAVTQRGAAALKVAAAAAKRLGSDIRIPGASAADAAQAMVQLAKGGLSLPRAMTAARGTLLLAAAAGLEVGQAATITVSALNAFRLGGREATRVADLLAAAASAAQGEISDMGIALQQAAAQAYASGLSVQETVTALSLLAKAGIIGSDAGTSLRVMLQRLVPQTKAQATLMRQLGIEVFDASGKMLPLREIVAKYSTVLRQLSPKQRQFVLQTLFGSDASRAANIILTQNVATYDAMAKKVGAAGEAQRVAGAKTKGWAGAVEKARNAVDTLAITVGEELLPILTPLLERFGKWVGRLEQSKNFHEDLRAKISAAVGAVQAFAAAAGRVVGVVNGGAQAVGGWEKAIRIALGVLAVRHVAKLAMAIRTQLIAQGFVALGVSSRAAAARTVASMGVMGVAAKGLSRTIRIALIQTGIGALIVAAGLAVEQIITHWDTIKRYTIAVARALARSWDALKMILIGVAKLVAGAWLTQMSLLVRGVLEIMAKLPGPMGRPFKTALAKLKEYTTGWIKEGALQMAEGGRVLGMSFASEFTKIAQDAIGEAYAAAGGYGKYMSSGTGVVTQQTRRGKGFVQPGVGDIDLGHDARLQPAFKQAFRAGKSHAKDFMASVGTRVLAPEDGELTRTSGRPGAGVPGGPGGRSLYYIGKSGTAYFMTHMEWVASPGRYRAGDVIGRVGPHVSGSHVHVEQSMDPSALAVARGGGGTGPPPPAVTNVGALVDELMQNKLGGGPAAKKAPAAAAKDSARAALAEQVQRINDLAGNQLLPAPLLAALRARVEAAERLIARASGKKSIPAIRAAGKDVKRAVDDAVKQVDIARAFTEKTTEARDDVRARLQELLPEPILQVGLEAVTAAQAAAARITAALASRIVTPAARTRLERELDRHRDTIETGLRGAAAAAEKAGSLLERSWAKVARRAFEAFDRETARGLAAIDARFGGLTPAEQALRDLEAAQERAARDLDRSDAQRALAEALAGGDPAEIADAQRRLADIAYEEKRAALQAQADQERAARDAERDAARAAFEEARAEQREQLEQHLEDLHQRLLAGEPVLAEIGGKLGVALTDPLVEAIREAQQAWKEFLDSVNRARVAVGLAPLGGAAAAATASGGLRGGGGRNVLALAKGGEFVTSGPTPLLVGEGATRERVRVTPIRAGMSPDGLAVAVNFHGDVYGVDADEFVRRLTSKIRDALLRKGVINNRVGQV